MIELLGLVCFVFLSLIRVLYLQVFTGNMNGILCVFAKVIAVAVLAPVDEGTVKASAKVLLN